MSEAMIALISCGGVTIMTIIFEQPPLLTTLTHALNPTQANAALHHNHKRNGRLTNVGEH